MPKKNKRFLKLEEESGFATSSYILVDTQTGVNYLYHSAGYGAGLTVLLDRDGKPVVTTLGRGAEE